MKFVAGVLACLSLCGSGVALAAPAQSYIVVTSGNAPRGVAAANGLAPEFVYEHALTGFSATMAPEAAAALAHRPGVVSVTADVTAHVVGQSSPTGVVRIGGPVAAGTPVGVGIAIIDTGIGAVADLNVVQRVVCTKGKAGAPATCTAGGVDDNNHGTHVAGTAAAIDNGIGVIGVAPGAPLYAVKVCNRSGACDLSQIIAGLDWVAAKAPAIRVANLSLGFTGTADAGTCATTTDALHKAICGAQAKGVTVVVAAGNETDDARNHLPAGYPEVITVSALDDKDGQKVGDYFASFSNYGPGVDVIAPGVNILSTLPDGTYGSYSGTSMATPHVSGAAALLIAANPSMTPADVAAALKADGDPLPCPTANGHCAGDPDGITEPLVWVGPPLQSCVTDADCIEGVCDAAGSCVMPACTADADCADADPCTAEVCADAGTALATCQNPFLACGGADSCCGPTCSGNASSSSYDADCPVGSAWAHVDDIRFTQSGRKMLSIAATATIVDGDGLPVAGASVTATRVMAWGTDSFTAVTDASGVAKVWEVLTDVTAIEKVTIDSVSHPSLSYDPVANVETCSTWNPATKVEGPCN